MKNSVINIVTVLQAHQQADSLPHKAILSIAGKPLLLTFVERIKACRLNGIVVVTTSNDEIDNEVFELCKNEKIVVFRGDKKNQLNTDYKIALKFDADVLLKISLNAPLIDPSVITKILKFYINNQYEYDYVSNLNPASYPEGYEVAVISAAGLKSAWRDAGNPLERENSTLYIKNNPHIFRIGNVTWEAGQNFNKSHRWLLDNEEDYIFIKKVFDELYRENPLFNIHDILLLLDKKPHLKYINDRFSQVNIFKNINDYKLASK